MATELVTFRVTMCRLCLDGDGAECHTAGCAYWMADVPTDEAASPLLMALLNDDEAAASEIVD